MKAFIESTRSQLEKSASCLLPMCFHRRCFSSSLLLLYISELFLLFRLFPPINVMPLCLSLTLFLSLSLQVQENVFVEFNHQQLLDLYNKVRVVMFRVCVHASFMPHRLRVFVYPCCILHSFILRYILLPLFLNISFRLPLLLCVILLCTHSLQKLIISPLSFSSKSSKDSWIP